MEDVYSRSPLMGVSQPTNFVHQVHVGFDPISGGFTASTYFNHSIFSLKLQGLPPQWSKLLTSSAITREEAARNPEAVLDVLQFYTTQQMGQNGGDYQLPSNPTMPSQPPDTAVARFEGVGLGGDPRQIKERERERERAPQARTQTITPTGQPESTQEKVSIVQQPGLTGRCLLAHP